MNKSSDNVIIVSQSDAAVQAVAKALDADGHFGTAARFHDIGDLAGHVEGKPAAVLVDIDPAPEEMLERLGRVAGKFSTACFIILASKCDERLILSAMAAGARHFMRKSSLDSDLAATIRRLAAVGEAVPMEQGGVITVLSAGGGCGATTLAVNLANELRIEEDKPVLLVDLDVAYGAVATYLDISGHYGLADVIGNGNVIDGDLVASSAVPYNKGLHVLLSPASVNFHCSRELKYEKLSQFTEACRQSYAFTVIDAPRVSPSVAADLAAASRATLVVLQLSVKDVRVARELRKLLIANGVGDENIYPVINRYRKKGWSVGLDEVCQAMGTGNAKLVSNDFRRALRSIDLGGPLAKTAPMSTLRKDIQKLLADMPIRSSVISGGKA